MADIQPFKGLRPKPELVQKVACPPYDVLNLQEARELAKDNPLSFLHVVKAEIDFGPDIDAHSERVYKKGAENLQKFLRDGILIQDASPCFYIYQITMGNHTQLGLMLGASVDEYEKGLIKKHEFTRRDKEDDRARHVDILNANTGPVMLSYHAKGEIDKHLETICGTSKPVYGFTAEDGVRHVLWVVSEPKDIERIQKNFLNVELMYIADDPLPRKPRHFTMFLDGKWYALIAKEDSFPADDPVLSLDVSILQKNVLESILDLYDIRTNDRIDFIGGIRGTKELEKRCSQDMRIAFALYPTSIGQLMSVSDSGEVMPPKSTWFEPKLRSGMVIRSLAL